MGYVSPTGEYYSGYFLNESNNTEVGAFRVRNGDHHECQETRLVAGLSCVRSALLSETRWSLNRRALGLEIEDTYPSKLVAKTALRRDIGVAQVNLLLNRAFPWMDIDSHLPYEGKVVLRNKAAQEAFVRIPLWADEEAVLLRCPSRLSNINKFDWRKSAPTV